MFEFINELSEARIFRTPNSINEQRIGDLADGFFMACLALNVLRYENPGMAIRYAKKTLLFGLDGWRSSGSDLSNMAFVLLNQDRHKHKLLLDRTVTVPRLQLLNWLRDIAKEREHPRNDQVFFMALQRGLGITQPGMKNTRRLVSEWKRTYKNEKQLATTKIHQELAARLPNTDLFLNFRRYSNKKNAMINVNERD